MSVVYTFTEHYMWGLSWYADMYEREGCLSATGVSEKNMFLWGVLVGFWWGPGKGLINTHLTCLSFSTRVLSFLMVDT